MCTVRLKCCTVASLKILEQSLLTSTKRRIPRRRLILNMLIRVKVLRIKRILNVWDPRSLDLLLQEIACANALKPGMITNVLVTTCETSETVGLTAYEKTLDQVLSLFVDDATFGEGVLGLYDVFEEAHLINSIRHEWGGSHEHFVNKHS